MPKLATPLTETQIAELKPRAKRYKIGGGHGLYILVEPTGIKRWQMVYKRQGMETSLRLTSRRLTTLSARKATQKLM
ncbi:Arm DNA-binding domain-containing protein [Collimonas humicola]|uniref:Arm DNA-binding domain-containing protein n=1 Tax=Collimonas humicola TaxID=2825886 RepID=UPI001B8C2883|nr:Arm DNA-binding domain-containing protein [Collimonas humicola]